MFTFKKVKPSTGLASVGEASSVTIKLHKKEVGLLFGPSWRSGDDLWRARLTVADNSEECGWRWITLKATFATEEEGRKWLKDNFKAICEKWELRSYED